ncbi:MAG TPA: PilZ domain-containing protein [Candidatus Nitrosotenuis sp.]|nr:PilZ domain-containing protein [Candidatus Nitrosotenuis sp.]
MGLLDFLGRKKDELKNGDIVELAPRLDASDLERWTARVQRSRKTARGYVLEHRPYPGEPQRLVGAGQELYVLFQRAGRPVYFPARVVHLEGAHPVIFKIEQLGDTAPIMGTVTVNWPATAVQVPGSGREHLVTVREVSSRGLRLTAPVVFPPGTRLRLSLRVPQLPLEVVGEVGDTAVQATQVQAWLRFVEISERDRARIEEFLASRA